MLHLKRPMGLLGAALLVALLLPFSATPAAAAGGATVPLGFRDESIWTGLDHPMAVVVAGDGSVFVALKKGIVLRYSSMADTTPTVFANLTTNVHNYWDRGMLGLAVDPGFATGRPYVYVLYAYNHILGDPEDPAHSPRWPSGRCPDPPGPTTDGCVVSGRLSQLTSVGGVMSGPEHVLIEDWCQQFPSHSIGGLMFGPEGALYLSAGDGASFNVSDYGQLGGTTPDTPTPVNPCGDPPGAPGTALTSPTAEGGDLRSQDLRTAGDPVGLDGTIMRVDPDTGAGWPTNALAGDPDMNARRIIGYGLRNPFRFTIRPGTSEVWLGDVGNATWEEIDRLQDPTAAPRNYGWPCWEGDSPAPVFQSLGLAICTNLQASEVTTPYFTYRHSDPVVPGGDGCTAGSSSVSGMTFLSSTSAYPDSYDGALFFTDYTRRCIWVMKAGGAGLPDVSSVTRFAQLDRATGSVDGGSVFLTTAPDGDVMYADFDRGEIRRVHYYGNTPPVASFTATPATGPAPLDVTFDASASSDVRGDPLTYAWDLDGDGRYDDATGVTASRTYTDIGNVTVGVKVTDLDDISDTDSKVISAGNAPPTVTIDTPDPSLTWHVGDTIPFSAAASDAQDGTLPSSAYAWTVTMRHCPSDCHSHDIETFSGVTSGSFVAPDHEVPSHLLLSVVVTDSNGSTGIDSIDLYPQTGTVSVTTSPPGIGTTAGESTGIGPVATAIVGSNVQVTAPSTASVGEALWTFANWSDGGDRTHTIPIVVGDRSVTATYTFTSTVDRPGTCLAAGSASGPTGAAQSGTFGTANDIDWYRFKLTKTTQTRLVLGNLTTGGRMELYRGCSALLQVSDRAGNGSEEIIRSLPAGTYAVRLVGSATPETANHFLRIKALGASVAVLSSPSQIRGSTLRLVGEVYNNTWTKRGQVSVTARLYDIHGKLLSTRATKVLLPYLSTHRRAPFSIIGSLPAGYDHVKWSVTAPTTSRRVVSPSTKTLTVVRDAAGRLVVTGTVKNSHTYTVRSVTVTITAYNSSRNAFDVVRAKVPTTTLGARKSTTFTATLPTIGLRPDLLYPRAVALH